MTDLDRTATLAGLATSRPGASRVFQRHGLDYCCRGDVAVGDACADAGLDADALLAEIQAEAPEASGGRTFETMPLDDLIEHVLVRYHEAHRLELPALIELARKVERVHGDKEACPRGLAAHLERMQVDLEAHMQKEEQVLFPLVRAGRGRMAQMPVQVMEQEHRDHGDNLVALRRLAWGFRPPAEACTTWRALYLRLEQLEHDLMNHISLENHVLFPRALRS